MRKSIPALSLAALVASAVLFLGARGHETAPKALGELPLTQSFRIDLGNRSSFTATMPTTAGLAVTEILISNGSDRVVATVNGAVVFNGVLGESTASPLQAKLNPPIVVPPSGTLQMTRPGTPNQLIISGYYLTLADIGL